MRRWQLGLIGVAALSVLLASWLRNERGAATEPLVLNAGPDYYMTDFVLYVSDAQGRPAYRLQAERFAHLAADDTGELVKPEFTLQQPAGPPWVMRAADGWIGPQGAELYLIGGVTMARTRSEDEPAIRITTEDLRVRPKDRVASTDLTVVATSGPHRLQGVGMFADLARERMQLLADVTGRYVP